VRSLTPAKQEPGIAELIQRGLQLLLRTLRERRDQFIGELAADHRANLRNLLGNRVEPIEPRHQRCVQACGDSQRRGRNRSRNPLRFALALRLQHRLRHFFHEQRDAVSAFDDVLPDARGQRLIVSDAVDPPRRLPAPEPRRLAARSTARW
jgi:hypothetical protein